MNIALESHNCAAGLSYTVTFEGDQAEARAIKFIDGRSRTHLFREIEEAPVDYGKYPQLLEKLYPRCEHNLSYWLCAGPGHYPADL